MAAEMSEPPGARPLTPLVAALWTVALTLVFWIVGGVTEAVRPGAENDIVNVTACQVLATSMVVFAMVRVHARDASLRMTLGVRPIAPLHLVLAIAAGAGLFPLLATVDTLVLKRWPVDDQAATEGLKKLLEATSPLALVVAAYVVMPLAREIFFRGITYGELRKAAGVRTALLGTAAFYACASLEWQEMPTAFALGLALAWLRERTGTVVAAVVAQLAFGAVEAIPILRGRDPQADVAYPARWIVGGAVISVLALAVVGIGRKSEDHDDT